MPGSLPAESQQEVVPEILPEPLDPGADLLPPILVVIGGAKALRRAVGDMFDHPLAGKFGRVERVERDILAEP